MSYHAISVQTELERRRELELKKHASARRQWLLAMDRILEQLEQLNLHDRTAVPPALARQLDRFGVSYHPSIRIPDLIELVFSRQEQFMLAPSERGSRVPTVEELEVFFELKSRTKVA